MTHAILAREIIARSVATTWEAAKREWRLHSVFESDVPETCLCGHYPIIENCELLNRINGVFATVGNHCVNKFMGLSSETIFQSIKRIRKDGGKSISEEALAYALERAWINDWEFRFYQNVRLKRNTTERQEMKKRQINEKFLLRFQQSERKKAK